ncbi:MAG: YqgE/AlgH family protein [Planctomycetota bacterium]
MGLNDTDAARTGGHFLVASPYLTDGLFFRSVVLMVRHEAKGALGMVINQPNEHQLHDVIACDTNSNSVGSAQVFTGGPVAGPLIALHDVAGLGDPCQVPVSDWSSGEFTDASPSQMSEINIPAWMTADEDHLRMLATRHDARVRFLVNYSGWGPGQLDAEIKAGGWLVTPADSETVFGDHESVWETLVRRCGRSILEQLAPETTLPHGDEKFDPGLN